MWERLSWAVEFWNEEPYVVLGSLTPLGDLTAKIFLLIVNNHKWVWASPFCISTPPTGLNVVFSLYP